MMTCGICPYNDGCVYTSLPPKYKCELTGEFHDGSEQCNVLADLVPVIRCKNCEWFKTGYSWDGKEYTVCGIEPFETIRNSEDYCSRAERKDNETD